MAPSIASELPTGIVTFLLTDVEDSSALWERDPGAMAIALERHDALVDENVRSRNGVMIKSKGEGDSTLSVFRRVSDAATAASVLQQAFSAEPWPPPIEVRLRMAVHTGEAYERAGDYFGPPVNRAARLRSIAEAGQVLISEVSATLLRDQSVEGIRIVDVGLRKLRGLAREEHVFALVTTGGTEVTSSTAPVLPTRPIELPLPNPLSGESSKLAGRESQVERLEAACAAARRGSLQTVFVAGEPGIGKTRLAAEVARRAHTQGALVMYGRCDQEMVVPYQPFVESLRPYFAEYPPSRVNDQLGGIAEDLSQLFPQLGTALHAPRNPLRSDPDVERYRVFEAFAMLFSRIAREQLVLLVLDDLHWADKPTTLLLRNLIRSASDTAVCVLGTYRDVELDRTSPLSELLAELERGEHPTRVVLRGLTDLETAELAREFLGHDVHRDLARALTSETSGNPFFIAEVLRHLQETRAPLTESSSPGVLDNLGLPDSVRDLVARRVARLPDDVQATLSLASVVGPEFRIGVLTRAGELSSEQLLQSLDRACAAGIIREIPDRLGHYTFSHALIRQTLYAEIGTARRVRLHAAIGAALESSSDPTQYVAVLAQHFAHAAAITGAAKAVDYALQAGEKAFTELAFEDAVGHFARGARVLDEFEPRDAQRRAELLVALADALMYTDQLAGQEAALRAVAAARSAQSPELIAGAVLAYSRVSSPEALATGHDPVLAALLDEILPAVADSHPRLRAQLLARQAFFCATYSLRLPDPQGAAAEALRLARTTGDPITLGDALFAYAACIEGTPSARERIDIGNELVELGSRDGVPRPWTFGLRVLARASLQLGDAPGFVTALDALSQLGAERRWVPAQAHAGQWLTIQASLAGRFDDARVFAAQVLRHSRVNRGFVALYGALQFHVLGEQGEVVDARAIEHAMQMRPENSSLRAMAALALLEQGDHDDARRYLDVFGADEFRTVVGDAGAPTAIARLAEVAATLQASGSCAPLYEVLSPFAGTLLAAEPIGCVGAADRYLGMLATVLERWDVAQTHFERAFMLEEQIGGWALLPRTRYWWSRLLLARDEPGDDEQARAALTEAVAETSELGMERLREQAEQLLAGA